MRIGFAGAGNIAGAMARGWARASNPPESMLFCDLVPGRAAALAGEVGGEERGDIEGVARDVDAVVLAVKPDALETAAAELSSASTVVSVLAGTPAERVSEAIGNGVPVIRVLPNVAVEVGAGIVCIAPVHTPAPLADELTTLLGELGSVVELEEELFDPAMAVMSCGPAFLAVVVEAMVEAAEREGLGEPLAHELLVETMAGTAALMEERAASAVREAVTSPGGATAGGLAALEAGAVRGAYAEAVSAAVERFRA